MSPPRADSLCSARAFSWTILYSNLWHLCSKSTFEVKCTIFHFSQNQRCFQVDLLLFFPLNSLLFFQFFIFLSKYAFDWSDLNIQKCIFDLKKKTTFSASIALTKKLLQFFFLHFELSCAILKRQLQISWSVQQSGKFRVRREHI